LSAAARETDGPLRSVVGATITGLAGLLVWLALVAPNEVRLLSPGALVRIPIEGLLVVAVVLALPPRPRRVVAVLVGVLLGVLTVVKILDMGFYLALGRPFNPVFDWGYLRPAFGLLSDSMGRRTATISLVAAGAGALAVLVALPLSMIRLTGFLDRHRLMSLRATATLGLVWVLAAALGLAGVQIVPGPPTASTSTARLAYDQVAQVRDGIKDQQTFAKGLTNDPSSNTPGDQLLTGLRGKDVIIAFVESYGRGAVQGSTFSPGVNAVLDSGTARLQAAGFSAKSAFLTSPTFGGISWLAHSTLQTGMWVNSQQRYNTVVSSNRFTLSKAFKRAGWRTVGDVPSNGVHWPQGKSFYRYDKLYNAHNVGYAGPRFSYASMPDQYVLSAFRERELAKANRSPVMAEIDLVSSHTPWAPLPHLVDWSNVGDGSIFDGMQNQGASRAAVWRDSDKVRAAYGKSIEYTLNSLISYVQTFHDDNLVLIVLGDHQPATIVSGYDASHDVPITIIAHDPAVMDRISGWGWQDGMRPHPNATVWPMDTFRDRFLTAYGPKDLARQVAASSARR
jgi:hypothetical protein